MTLQNCKIRPGQFPYFFLYAGQIHKLSDVRVFEAPYITGFSHVLHLIKSCKIVYTEILLVYTCTSNSALALKTFRISVKIRKT